MSSLEVSVTVGDRVPLTVAPTTTDVMVFSGEGYCAGWSLREVTADTPASASGSVVAPAANAVIAQQTGLAAGTYRIHWEVELQGAAAAADANNFKLVGPAGSILVSVNQGAAGVYAQIDADITVAQNSTVSVQAVGAGTAGVTYSANLSLDPTSLVEAIVELKDGDRILGEISLVDQTSDTRDLGDPGVQLNSGITVHVISGKVAGVVYATFDQYFG